MKRLIVGIIGVILVLSPAAMPQSGAQAPRQNHESVPSGPSRADGARVDGVRVERTPDQAHDGETPGEIYTDEDVVARSKRETKLDEVETLEVRCFNEVNRLRVSHGLAPLSFNDDLLRVARSYSKKMADEGFFAHNDPDGHTVKERVTDANIKWRVLGENLAYSNGYINPVAVSLSGWMDSPGHRRNLLDRIWRQTAVGAWITDDGTVYFTEIFLAQ